MSEEAMPRQPGPGIALLAGRIIIANEGNERFGFGNDNPVLGRRLQQSPAVRPQPRSSIGNAREYH